MRTLTIAMVSAAAMSLVLPQVSAGGQPERPRPASMRTNGPKRAASTYKPNRSPRIVRRRRKPRRKVTLAVPAAARARDAALAEKREKRFGR
ncbi:MAG: hypothetical protein WB783_04260, partial [Arenicellales bacterium]